MSTDVTHLSGYVIIIPNLQVDVTHTAGYVLLEVLPSNTVESVTTYYLLENRNRIPQFRPDVTAILNMINAVSSDKLKENEVTISDPVVIEPDLGRNTSILVTPSDQMYLGDYEFKYTRRDIEESFTEISVAWKYSVYELLDELKTATGLELSERDVVNETISIGQTEILLVASDISFFFIPGTSVVITLTSA